MAKKYTIEEIEQLKQLNNTEIYFDDVKHFFNNRMLVI